MTDSSQFPWFALQVHVKREQSVASHLRSRGYNPLVPVYKYQRHWSDRIKIVEAPLFPGYLFCRLDLQNRLPLLATPGVTQIVSFGKIPAPVDEAEISAIQTGVQSGFSMQPWPFLRAGDRVRIEGGPLRGLEGILLEFRGTQRLVLSVTLLQRSVAVEIDPTFVKSLPPAVCPQLHANEYVSSTSSKKAVGILG